VNWPKEPVIVQPAQTHLAIIARLALLQEVLARPALLHQLLARLVLVTISSRSHE